MAARVLVREEGGGLRWGRGRGNVWQTPNGDHQNEPWTIRPHEPYCAHRGVEAAVDVLGSGDHGLNLNHVYAIPVYHQITRCKQWREDNVLP